MKPRTAYGAYLILPFKYDSADPDYGRLEASCPRLPVRTMDINENVKAMLNDSGETAVGSVHTVSRALLAKQLCGGILSGCRVTGEGIDYDFDLLDSYLYVFHTRIAFLCLGLSFTDMNALQTICNPGFAENDASFFWLDEAGQAHEFSLGRFTEQFMARWEMNKFFDGEASVLLESYTYILGLSTEFFGTLEELRQATFHLHQMLPLDTAIADDSEEDIRYVYAVKNQERNAYRWGCCIASQTISYVVADPELDFDAEMLAQAQDGMPIVLLALYEKYTCLRFSELISKANIRQARRLKELKSLMLRFRAFGTVTAANLSRWHNIRQIFANLQEVHDLNTAIEDTSTKLSILTEHQQALEHGRNETVINIITIFGIVSILASVLSIIQILSDGSPLFWISTVLTTLGLAAVFLIALRFPRS